LHSACSLVYLLQTFAAFHFPVLFAASALAAEEEVIYHFRGGTDGYYPTGTLLKDRLGNLYGTTAEGGAPGRCQQSGCGTVFQLAPPIRPGDPWVETVLYRFPPGSDGSAPGSALVSDCRGNLYSTTSARGTRGWGTVFELERPTSPRGTWTHHVLYSFKGVPSGKGNGDGALPGGVVFDAAGNLYGTTDTGGFCIANQGLTTCYGSVFRLAPPGHSGGAWTESVLYRFGPFGLSNPHGGVIFDKKGNLYGTTYVGGNGFGGIFGLSPPSAGNVWAETNLFEFYNTDGGAPDGSLIFDSLGNLYGTTLQGGLANAGTVFDLSPPASQGHRWTEPVLHSFQSSDGSSPLAELIFDRASNLYGTAWMGGKFNGGTLFQLTPPFSAASEWTETTLHNFGNGQDGSEPGGGLIFGQDGALWHNNGGRRTG
jgi:uncharacterized repeat protein (TIGR03803 family)